MAQKLSLACSGDEVPAVQVPGWAVEAAASAPRISAADAGPLIAIFTAVRGRTESEQAAA